MGAISSSYDRHKLQTCASEGEYIILTPKN